MILIVSTKEFLEYVKTRTNSTMIADFSFYFYRTAARAFGSILFPLFSGWGENEIKAGQCQVIFGRNHGFISLLNSLRFFKNPFSIVARSSDSKGILWKLAQLGGLKIYRLADDAGTVEACSLIRQLREKKETPLFLISESHFNEDNSIVCDFTEAETLFFAVSGCKKVLSMGFVPLVTDMKALCASIPVYGEEKERFKGLKSLLFLEKSLEMTPKFDLPTFFYTHSRFSTPKNRD